MRINVLIFAISIFLFSSCNEILEINPKTEVVSDDMFTTQQGTESALYGLYGSMNGASMYGKNLSWGVTELLAQNLKAPINSQEEKLQTYNYEITSAIFKTVWTNIYKSISYANNIIINMEALEGEKFKLNDIYLGEAYGLRANLHFEALRWFAPNVINSPNAKGIPYVTTYSFKLTDFVTVEKAYELVINDLKKAQELLIEDTVNIQYPRQSENSIEEPFLKGRNIHLNYYASCALLARVYWMKGDMEKAKIEALKVINSDKFHFVDHGNLKDLIAGTLSEDETIFGIYSTSFHTSTSSALYNISDGSYKLFFEEDNISIEPYEKIYRKYQNTSSGTDERVPNWFKEPKNTTTKNLLKMVDVTYVESNDETPSKRGLIEGYSIIRIPEMYYIVAEAELESGNIGVATEYFNKVINARGLVSLENRVPALTLDKEMLYNERRKEFFGEGVRWFDLKRNNFDIVDNVRQEVFPASDDYYVFPITDDEFDYRVEN